MGSATVKTAAATNAILDQTVKAMAVKLDGSNPAWAAYPIGDLICTRWDDSIFSAGSVIGPQGEEGPAGPVNAGDLDDLKDDIGYGIIAFDSVDTDQTWGFDEDGYNLITSLEVVFPQVTGRSYRVEWCSLMYSGADNVTFVIECRDGGTVIGRSGGFSKNNGRSANIPGKRVYTAGTTATKTLKLYAAGDTANDIHINSDYVDTWLSVEDLGVI